MIRNENELSSNAIQMLSQARAMENWELCKASIYNHSQMLEELQKNEINLSEVIVCKMQIAIIELALREKIYETDYGAARAFKEIREEITEQFPRLFEIHNLTEDTLNTLTDIHLSRN